MHHLSEDERQLLQSCAKGARVLNGAERTSSHQRLLELGLINEAAVEMPGLIASNDAACKLLPQRSLISLTDAGWKELRGRIRNAASS